MKSGYRGLGVWNKAYEMSLGIYDVTRSFPQEEMYGITSQMRRASTSIIANLAEGHGRAYVKEYAQFVSIAIGSCNELEVFLLLAHDLELTREEDHVKLVATQKEVSKMLFSLRRSLKKKGEILN